MSNYFIFGIGGTGSRVVRSLTMLLAAGVKPFKANDKIFPILIDYDVENGDTKRATECIGTYHNIHAAAFTENIQNQQALNYRFFSAPIMEMKEMSKQCKSGFVMQFGTDNEQPFSQWIAYNQLSGAKKHTLDILSSLYDDSTDVNAELQLNMKVGFKGNPNIGSIVFHSLKDTPEFDDFCSLYKRSNDDKVIIVGSLFGGTGSSGIPEMVQAIRNNPQPEVNNADIAVVMVCPYFKFRGSDEKGTVRSSIFNSKTKAALNFYKASGINEMVNSLYYLGDQQPTTLPYCEGGKNQRNNSHLVDLLGAMSVVHFASTNNSADYTIASRSVGNTNYYKYRMAVDLLEENTTNDNDTNENDRKDTLNFSNFLESELETVFYPLTSFALALRYFHDEIARKTKNVNEADFYTTLELGSCFGNNGVPQTSDTGNKYLNQLRAYCAAMMTFYSEFTHWNEELKDHATHGLNLYDFDSANKINQFICGITLETREKILGFTKENSLLDIEVDITELISDAWKELKKLKFAGLDSNDKAFLLDDVLTKGCRQIFNADKPDKSVKRRRVLDSKLIDKKMKAAGTTTTN